MSTVPVRPSKAFVFMKPNNGGSASYIAGGDYNVRPEVAAAMVEAGVIESPDVAVEAEPVFTRPSALEPEDTGDLVAEDED